MGLTGNTGSSQHDSQAKRTQGKTGVTEAGRQQAGELA
jgi:hypothetical protein